VHLYFVSHRGRRLRILDVVHVLIYHLGLHVVVRAHLVVVNVVFAASGSRTSWIGVDASNSIV